MGSPFNLTDACSTSKVSVADSLGINDTKMIPYGVHVVQFNATDPSGNTQIVLSDSQRAEIEKFQQDLLSIRKELRDVQFALRSDVEELTGKIKLVNIAAMPLAVAVLAILGAFVRNQRRKSFQAKFAEGAAPGGASRQGGVS